MTRREIETLMREKYTALLTCLRQMPADTARRSMGTKWSPAQQAEHLVKSVRPVALAFSLPKFMLPIVFGKSNRPSRTYDELVAKYKGKLSAGGKSSKPFIPGEPGDLPLLFDRLEKVVEKLNHRIGSFSEEDLDRLILPHPLLGKLTLREMLYFTAYHAGHHHAQVDSMTFIEHSRP